MTCNAKKTTWDKRSRLLLSSSEHFWMPKFDQRNDLVTIWWTAAALIHFICLNSCETIIAWIHGKAIDRMHKRCVFVLHWAIVQIQSSCKTMIDTTSHNQLPEFDEIALTKLLRPADWKYHPQTITFFWYLDIFLLVIDTQKKYKNFFWKIRRFLKFRIQYNVRNLYPFVNYMKIRLFQTIYLFGIKPWLGWEKVAF